MVSYQKEVIDGWDHLMHAIELGSEVAQSLLVSHLEVEVYSKNKQMEFCHEMSNGAIDIFWAMAMVGATNGLVGSPNNK